MAIEIDLRIPPCGPATEVAEFAAQCEEAGFDGVGILDSQMLERDVFVSMAFAAQATKRIRISSAVINPVTRHISVLASAAKTVAELAPGRVEFWLGRGFSSVQTVGVRPATVQQMREAVLTLKRLLRGEEVSFNGATSRMRHGDADVPPIYIAAHGPRAIEMAGEVADGVLLQVGIHPKSVDVARQHLEAGAKRAGRDPSEIKIALTATTIIHEDQQQAREIARPMCAQRLIEASHEPYLRAAGIDPGELDIPQGLKELYPDIPHAEDWEEAMRLCAFLPDDLLAQMCDAIGLVGTPEYCAQRLREAEAGGIDRLYLMTSETYQFPHRELRAFQDTIFPSLAVR
jgi:5,10-methylenetetrahydromethanopterin reductase